VAACSVAGPGYLEAMTILILIAAVIAILIATVVGYVAVRDRRHRGTVVDHTISRDAFVSVDRQAAEGRYLGGLRHNMFGSYGAGGDGGDGGGGQ
jgi:hypothetical protein